jgi:hypothetical protein
VRNGYSQGREARITHPISDSLNRLHRGLETPFSGFVGILRGVTQSEMLGPQQGLPKTTTACDFIPVI